MPWSIEDVPDLSERVVVVTGATSGIGFAAATAFVARGARVVLACRSAERGRRARERILEHFPGAALESIDLDLASLRSVRGFVERFEERHRSLDVLCNNAGIMAVPYARTVDGFEQQLAVNHLGHFALTGLLLPSLLRAERSRVVTVSSQAHRSAIVRWDDLSSERSYRPMHAYMQSKLANLLFAQELARRLEPLAGRSISVACHPGLAATNLPLVAPRLEGARVRERVFGWINRYIAQSADAGALSMLRAATDPSVENGEYYGPAGFYEMNGAPIRIVPAARALDARAARRLWNVSCRLTGVAFEALEGATTAARRPAE